MDFDRITENAELFDPDGQVVRSTQTVEEESGSQDGAGPPAVTVGGNLPGQNLPPVGPNSAQSSATRVEETTNFEISRTVKTSVRESGNVRRLSVAVLINGTTTENADGQKTYQPRSPEEMEQLAALVRSAVGFSEDRGDVLELVNLPFSDAGEDLSGGEAGSLFGLGQAELMRIAEILVLGVVAVLVLLLVVRPLVGRVIEGEAGEGVGALTDQSTTHAAIAGPGGEDGDPEARQDSGVMAEEIEQMIDLNKVEGRVRASSVRKIGEIVDKHPDEAVSIIRNWLYQET